MPARKAKAGDRAGRAGRGEQGEVCHYCGKHADAELPTKTPSIIEKVQFSPTRKDYAIKLRDGPFLIIRDSTIRILKDLAIPLDASHPLIKKLVEKRIMEGVKPQSPLPPKLKARPGSSIAVAGRMPTADEAKRMYDETCGRT